MEEPISAALRGTFVLFGVISIVLFFTNRKRAFAFPALILSGLVIGLFGVGRHSVNMLAEFGLIALLFHIGLKFPASRLREMWKVIVVGGLAQVFLTAGFGFVGALFFGLDPKASIVVGLAASMSSTALVAAFLKNRNEQNTPHGSISIAILVAQDLLVLPLVLVTTLLFPGGHSPCASGTGILTAFGVLVAVVVCGRLFLGPLLSTVLQAANQQLFVVVIASVVIGVGWALAAVGLSPALGGLIVGLLIGSHDCRLEAVEATRPSSSIWKAPPPRSCCSPSARRISSSSRCRDRNSTPNRRAGRFRRRCESRRVQAPRRLQEQRFRSIRDCRR